MKAHEQVLAALMLRDYSNRLSDDGCNDWEWPEDWSVEQRVEFTRDYHEFNGSLSDFDPSFLSIPNFGVAHLLANKLMGGPKPISPERVREVREKYENRWNLE